MLRFEIWYKRVINGRAPEYVNLEQDYNFAGILVGKHKRDIEIQLSNNIALVSKSVGKPRAIQVGDVLADMTTIPFQYYIYTPLGSWSLVKVLKNMY